MSKTLLVAGISVMLISATVVPTAFAQSATNQTWVSLINYHTPSETPGTLSVSFYTEGSATPISFDIALPAHTPGQILVGGVSTLPTGIKSAAVLSSDVYVVATVAQTAASPETTNYPNLLYTGFSDADASSKVYLATVLNKAFGSTTTFAIQNTESFAVTANVKLYAVGSTTPTANKNYDIPSHSDVILGGGSNLGALNLPAGFTGSAVITGAKKGDAASPGKVVAVARETDDAGRNARAYEGVASGANTIYMASMLCKAGGVDPQISYYAIQNTSLTQAAQVTIDFYNTAGALITSMPVKSVPPGGKISENPCVNGVPEGVLGSAVIKSTGGQIIAMGKVSSNGGIGTAFIGTAAGVTKVAAPYIRYAADPTANWRTFVAVMNIGTGDAVNIQAKYYDANGVLRATHALASASNPLKPFFKRNTDAKAAGAVDAGGNFGYAPAGGAVELTSDQPIVVVVRVSRSVLGLGSTTSFAEDYNGVPIRNCSPLHGCVVYLLL